MYVLPMSSEEPDSAIIWTRESFAVTGFTSIYGFNFHNSREIPADKIDSIRAAKLIYIPGGVQSRFMEAIKGTPVAEAIHEAYRNGALIAGTSAGAAVMSKKMITGDLLKPQSAPDGYTTIEADNIDLAEGLGLLPDVIVDQHFIKRQRLNRLVAAAIENPDQLCAGIDESTAIIVEGDYATVTGLSQVVVIRNKQNEKIIREGLLGSKGMELSVYLPGDKFKIR
jgi:cyanophycinase